MHPRLKQASNGGWLSHSGLSILDGPEMQYPYGPPSSLSEPSCRSAACPIASLLLLQEVRQESSPRSSAEEGRPLADRSQGAGCRAAWSCPHHTAAAVACKVVWSPMIQLFYLFFYGGERVALLLCQAKGDTVG